jgi:hypothetical protein
MPLIGVVEQPQEVAGVEVDAEVGGSDGLDELDHLVAGEVDVVLDASFTPAASASGTASPELRDERVHLRAVRLLAPGEAEEPTTRMTSAPMATAWSII